LSSGQRRAWIALINLLLLMNYAAKAAHAETDQSVRPRLVLLLIADQFSYDYLSRFRERFGTGGFRLLLDGGANFTNCRFQQASNQTASGQAVIATGAYPWANGIVANRWYDRHHDKVASAALADDDAYLSGMGSSAGSNPQLVGTTISDQLKLATNGRSKVFSLALTDITAILMAGKLANGAYWWDTRTGSFVSSSPLGRELPTWAKTFNEQHYSERYFGKPWQRLSNEADYSSSTRDDYPHERTLPGDGTQFPHVITGGAASPTEGFYANFAITPWANEMLVDFAKSAIAGENLGTHTDPDLLSINFSSTESLTNFFGPNSEEAQDMVMRLDQNLAGLLKYVDQRVGLTNCLIVFTADHGVSAIPELLRERGFDAGRIDPKSLESVLNNTLAARLGKGDWVKSFEPPNLYLNLQTIDSMKYRQPDVEALAAKSARSVTGVGEVYTAAQFFLNEMPNGPLAQTVRQSYYWGRSGELVILPKPGYVLTSETAGTASGSPFSYDAQVPLVLYGSGIRAGRYSHTANPADLAPTLASLLEIDTPSSSEGRALAEAFAQAYGPPRPHAVGSFATESP
jgi:arylsulfatase A-like enzyme